MYTKISNKLAGLLVSARKHNYVNFDGEILLQEEGTNTKIILLEEKHI